MGSFPGRDIALAWYYARGDERMGPVDDAAMDQLVRSGTVTPQTLVWKEGMEEWQPLGTIAPVSAVDSEMPASLFGEQSMQPCAECGRAFVHDDMVAYEGHWVCADCKEIFFQRIREGGGVVTDLRYGGFWIRFCARVVDGFIGISIGLFLNLVQWWTIGTFGFTPSHDYSGLDIAILVFMTIFSFAIGIWYEVYFVGKFAATPGKMVFGLKVVMSDGSKVSYWRATGRYFATWLSSMTLLIGYIIAAFDSEKRALHDHICDTRVVRK